MEWKTTLPIVISLLALVVAGITLWRTQFLPFKLITTAGPMSFRRHSMSSEDDDWYIPHFATTLSFTNSGSAPGRILDIRAVVRYPSLPISDPYEVFRCGGEFDPQAYSASSHQRFRMMGEARIAEFTPFVVLPKSTTTKFLVFSKRWDGPVRQERIKVDVQITTDRNSDWVTIKSWEYLIPAGMWAEIEHGSSLTTSSGDVHPREISNYVNPPDLHKYTNDRDLDPSHEELAGPTREVVAGRPVSDVSDPDSICGPSPDKTDHE